MVREADLPLPRPVREAEVPLLKSHDQAGERLPWAIWSLKRGELWSSSEDFSETWNSCGNLPEQVFAQPWGAGGTQIQLQTWPLEGNALLRVQFLEELPGVEGASLLIQVVEDSSGSVDEIDHVKSSVLKQLLPRVIHQLRNHLTVVQNSSAAIDKARERKDDERVDRCIELALKGMVRADSLLSTISCIDDWDEEQILSQYRKRFEGARIHLQIEGELPSGDSWLGAVICSLEHCRPLLPPNSTLKINCEENAVHFSVDGLDSIAVPPLQEGYFASVLRCQLEGEIGWVITSLEGDRDG